LPSELVKLAVPELELDTLRRIVEWQALCREHHSVEPVRFTYWAFKREAVQFRGTALTPNTSVCRTHVAAHQEPASRTVKRK
jgi:hypothetical protein